MHFVDADGLGAGHGALIEQANDLVELCRVRHFVDVLHRCRGHRPASARLRAQGVAAADHGIVRCRGNAGGRKTGNRRQEATDQGPQSSPWVPYGPPCVCSSLGRGGMFAQRILPLPAPSLSSPREVPQVDRSRHPGVVSPPSSPHTGTRESVYHTQVQRHASLPTTPTLCDKAATAHFRKLARLFGEGGQKQARLGNGKKKKRCPVRARGTNTPPEVSMPWDRTCGNAWPQYLPGPMPLLP